ncbi:MAG: hypothetical protein DKM50_10585 [Candidatus Margulisiibacteriota bacterium]|nr:MAG: hypothetical protein A2X43_07020 [Candidatus Margulisbacteria bacterium GWD2_39_127]OGI02969.1 MAG: hypothetical protein A2X42_12815 [Candidatus Margulisbacteria bacterium GWF2_38_17]OGI09438.1 MAG: hypothetical protein A2X41_12430 [Candidatus Margulisbacteria bacterium GWE2_39_32]PZM78762.1 MAG: hypothetical protein DKM50_10585 [Candidatus Margulisiibacteriota bacterium]HAR63336.1 hypothetical protein [Candidatus Margulisiibacteriota bacterium]
MNRLLFIILALICLTTPVGALTFTDIPEGHWARNAVYGIVRYGITQGYPDLTFQGTATINRYELASYFWNYIQANEAKKKNTEIEKSTLVADKLAEELKDEMYRIRTELAAIKKLKEPAPPASTIKTEFSFGTRGRFSNIFEDKLESKLYENRFTAQISNQINSNTSFFALYDSHWLDITSKNVFNTLENVDAKMSTSFDIGMPSPLTVTITSGPGYNINKYNHFANQLSLSTSITGFVIETNHQQNYNALKLSFKVQDTIVGTIDAKLTGELYNKSINTFKASDSQSMKTALNLNFAPTKQLKIETLVGAKLKKKFGAFTQIIASIGDILRSGTTYKIGILRIANNYYHQQDTSTEEILLRQLFDNEVVFQNDRYVYELIVDQKISKDSHVIIEFNQNGKGFWQKNGKAIFRLTLIKELNKSSSWFTNFYKDNKHVNYLRSGLAFSF